ncbi:HipB Predicted transcriptional regulators [Fimbriimonadaceae bacterium]
MNVSDIRRRQLDAMFRAFPSESVPTMPANGWLRAIREALGVTLEVLAGRLNVSKQAVNQLEKAEASGHVTVNRLREAANALDCDLVVLVVPRRPLSEQIEQRATELATKDIRRISHSMRLEDQGVSPETEARMVRELAAEYSANPRRNLW